MSFITQGKTNWKFLLIVVVLAVVVGGGISWYSKEQIKPPADLTQDSCSLDSDCQFYCGCGCVLKNTPGCPNPNFACEYDSCNSCRCLNGKCVSWSEIFIEAQQKKDINLCQEIRDEDCKEQCLEVLTNLLEEDETADWQIYRNEKYGFEFEYPLIPSGCGNCIITSNDEAFYVGRFSFDIEDLEGSDLSEHVYKAFPEEWEEAQVEETNGGQYLKETFVESRENMTVGGQEAIKIDYRFGGIGRFGTATFLEKDKKVFSFGFTAGVFCCGQGDQIYEMDIYDAILSTFRFIEEEIANQKKECAESEESNSCYISLAKKLKDPCICDEIKYADPHLQCRKDWIDFVAPLKDSGLCNRFENCTRGGNYYKYECYRKMAGKDTSTCEKLDSLPFKNSCYIKVAFDLKSSSVCDNLVEIELESLKEEWSELYYFHYFPRRVEYLNSKEVCSQISQEPEPWMVYQNKEGGWEINYPNNFIVKENSGRVVFTSPENVITLTSPEIGLWGGKYYDDFAWIHVEEFDVEQTLEEWAAKEYRLGEFEEFEITPEESGWNVDSIKKIMIGEVIPAIQVHEWAQAYDFTHRYIKHENVIIAIENGCFSGSEDTPIFNQMLSAFSFIETTEGFCGWSTYGNCSSDLDCLIGGCSGEVCGSKNEEPFYTTCVWRDCYDNEAYGVECKCVANECQWIE